MLDIGLEGLVFLLVKGSVGHWWFFVYELFYFLWKIGKAVDSSLDHTFLHLSLNKIIQKMIDSKFGHKY